MSLRTAVIDTADWLLAVPVLQRPGETLDFTGTLLTIDFAPELGKPPIASASSEDGSLVFVPSLTAPFFQIDLHVASRTWRIARPTNVVGDILRHPDPLVPARVEWLDRIELTVHPGSNSTGIALGSQAPVLVDAHPYDRRVVTTPMIVGSQGAPGYPSFDPVADEGKTLTIIGGVPVWA